MNENLPKQPIQILLVENNPEDAWLVEVALQITEADGCVVTRVANLAGALEGADDPTLDVILLDLFLPDSEGLETLRQMRLAAPRVPIVVLTGLDDEELAVRSLQNGAEDYLVQGEISPRMLFRSLRYARERHRLRTQLETKTVTDELTGLYNRRGFLSVAQHQLDLARRREGCVLLLYADLDLLKDINDKLGHEEGDRALCEAANTLRGCFRTTDVVARLGGDEFAVLAIDPGSPGSAAVRQRLQSAIAARNAQPGRPYVLSLSIGQCWSSGGCSYSLDEMVSRADAAMYQQKREQPKSRAVVLLVRTVPGPANRASV